MLIWKLLVGLLGFLKSPDNIHMSKENPKEIIILGMHRSGTSMLSGMLDRLGIDMGDDQPGRQLSNPLGHFEDGDLLSLNEYIISQAGGSWDNPPPAALVQNQAAKLDDRIQEIILNKRLANPDQPWGWKDPRTSLTINLYLPYLRNPYIIWSQRDPESISNSLWVRNKIPANEANKLTEYYQEQIIDFVGQHPELPVLKIPYQDMIDQPDYWIRNIVGFLDLEVDEVRLRKAADFVLPKEKIQRERKILWWKSMLLLPVRALRKFGVIKKKHP